MTRYLVRRLYSMALTLLGLTVLVFLMLHLIPGTVVEQMIGADAVVSPVMTERIALTVMTYGTVVCYESATGKKLWEHEFDGPFHASPLVINNVVHLIDRTGLMHRFEAGNEFKLLNKPALGEPVSATPAVAGQRLLIRGETTWRPHAGARSGRPAS